MACVDSDFTDLMERFAKGDEDAARELVKRYTKTMRRAVRHHLDDRLRSKFDSVDFVQHVLMSLYRIRKSLDCLDNHEELTAFLVTMARNKVLKENTRRLKTQKYNVKREFPLGMLNAEEEPNVLCWKDEPTHQAMAHDQLEHLMHNEKSRCRTIILLRLDGFSHSEIAAKLRVSESTIRRVLQQLEDKA